MREKCQKIIDHGINCFINRQLIYNFPEEIFADAGVGGWLYDDDGVLLLSWNAVYNIPQVILLTQVRLLGG
jgi:hypothetical protein